jgi:hypothetical protein
MAANRTLYTSPKDRRLHLEANARARGGAKGSLFTYEADREAMKKVARGGVPLKAKGEITSGYINFSAGDQANLLKQKRKKY